MPKALAVSEDHHDLWLAGATALGAYSDSSHEVEVGNTVVFEHPMANKLVLDVISTIRV